MEAPGIAVNFFAALIGAMLNIILIHVKPQFAVTGNTYELSFVLLIALMVVRHHCRVVFIDSTTASYIPHGYVRTALYLLMPLVIIGSGLLVYFAYNMVIGAVAATAYSILFLVFWIVLLMGSRGVSPALDDKAKDALRRRYKSATFGVVVDFSIAAWWLNWTFRVLTTEVLILSGENTFFVMVITILITAEILIIYREPIIERWALVKKHLI